MGSNGAVQWIAVSWLTRKYEIGPHDALGTLPQVRNCEILWRCYSSNSLENDTFTRRAERRCGSVRAIQAYRTCPAIAIVHKRSKFAPLSPTTA